LHLKQGKCVDRAVVAGLITLHEILKYFFKQCGLTAKEVCRELCSESAFTKLIKKQTNAPTTSHDKPGNKIISWFVVTLL
jgi:hypothetical protein